MSIEFINGIIVGLIFTITVNGILFRKYYNNLNEQKFKLDNFNELRKTYIDADNSLIYLKDENLKYVFVNKALIKFCNKFENEIIGHKVFELYDQEFAKMSYETDIEVLEKNTNITTEVSWNNRILQQNKFPVKLTNGKYGVGAYIKDATEEFNNKNDLIKANKILKENEENLQLILNSTAEAIYGMDLDGNCTFCNKSCLKMLGYENQDELLGKNMHWQIHHSYRDGKLMQLSECRILVALNNGEGAQVDDEVFWRADGTSFDVEYFSYPQYRDGEIIGAVVTFMDITSRKKAERDIIHLSYHDALTGLYNRRFFEEELFRLDVERNLPISIIMGDVNGLKLTNDVFGHAAGDLLLQKAALTIKSVCRADDIITRWGGDEYIVILPKTSNEDAEIIARRIKDQFSKENIKDVSCSIAVGSATKYSADENVQKIIEKAEERMYSQKFLERKNYSKITT